MARQVETRGWDSPGMRWVTFIDGKSREVDVKSIVKDHIQGLPVLVIGQDDTVYNWNNIVAMSWSSK